MSDNRPKGIHRRAPEAPGFEVTAQMALVRRRGRTLDCSTRSGRNSSCTGSSRNRPTRVRMEASVKGASHWVLRARTRSRHVGLTRKAFSWKPFVVEKGRLISWAGHPFGTVHYYSPRAQETVVG